MIHRSPHPNDPDNVWPDDGSEDRAIEEERMCSSCNGSGQGMYDGWTCWSCNGKGVERPRYLNGELIRVEPAHGDKPVSHIVWDSYAGREVRIYPREAGERL